MMNAIKDSPRVLQERTLGELGCGSETQYVRDPSVRLQREGGGGKIKGEAGELEGEEERQRRDRAMRVTE